jgi:hypothetical protein
MLKKLFFAILLALPLCALFAEENVEIGNHYGPLLMDYGMPVNIWDRGGQTAVGRLDISAVKNMTRKERWGEIAREPVLWCWILATLGYIGGSIVAKEIIYRDNPQANWVGTMNAATTGFAVGASLAAVPFIYIGRRNEDRDRISHDYADIFSLYFVPFVGVLTSVLATKNRDTFKENAFLYYGSTALVASLPVFIGIIWF